MTAGLWAVARELGCARGGELAPLFELETPPLLSGSQPAADKQLLGTCRVQSVWSGPGYGLAPLGACSLEAGERSVCERTDV